MAQVEIKWVFPGAKEAADAIDKINQSMKQSGDTAKESTGKMDSAISGNIQSLAAWAAGFATVAAAADFIRDSVAAAVESEKATAQLARQVAAAGLSWDSYGKTIDDAIQSVSKYALVQDEDVSDALREMISITNDVRESTKNLNLVTDLAYAKNISLSQAATIVGRAMEGDLRSVAQFLPELKHLEETLGQNATTGEKVAATFDVMRERFSGATASMPEYEKAVKSYDLAWDELHKTAGLKILPVLTSLFKTLDEGTKKLSENISAIKNASTSIDSVYESLRLLTQGSPLLRLFFEFTEDLKKSNVQLEIMSDHLRVAPKDFDAVKASIEEIPSKIEKVSGYSKDAFEEMAQFAKRAGANIQVFLGTDIQKKAKETFDWMQTHVAKSTADISADLKTSFQTIEHVDLEDATRGFSRLKLEIGEINGLTEEQIKDIAELNDKGSRSAREIADEWKRFYDLTYDLNQTFHDFTADTFRFVKQSFGDSVAEMIVEGKDLEKSLKQIGKNVLEAFISTWTQIGVEYAGQWAGIQAFAASHPIVQQVVLTTDPTNAATVTAPGGVGAGGGAGGGLAGAAGVAGGVYAFNTGLHADTTEERITAMAINPVTGGAGLIANQFGHELTLNQRLNRAYGQSAVDAARNAVTDRVWDRLSGDQKAGLIEFMNSHGGLTPDQVASNPIYRQASTLKEQIDRTADQASRDSLQKQLSDLLANVSPTDRRNLGLAKGGIVTREGWFNLGEMGKKEAVVPLESPEGMRALGGMGGKVEINISGTNFWDEITYHKFIRRVRRDIANTRFS